MLGQVSREGAPRGPHGGVHGAISRQLFFPKVPRFRSREVDHAADGPRRHEFTFI